MTKKSLAETIVPERASGAREVTVGPIASGYVVEDMFSSIEALGGTKVEFVGVIPAEVSRQANQYALLRVRAGRRTYRLMLAFAEVMRPCPSGNEMWDLLETFFTAEEIKARYQNKPLDLPRFEETDE